MPSPTITCIVDRPSITGEGAVWDDRAGCLWWVDIPAGLIFRLDPETGENRQVDFGEPVGCLAVREQGGLVLAAKSGFWFFDYETGKREAIGDPEADLPGNRFNDGTTDSHGRLWAGTMEDGVRSGAPKGSYYRLDPDGTITRWGDKVEISNGLAFTPDGNAMYFADTAKTVRTVWRAPYDAATGTPDKEKSQVFFDTGSVAGRPDGATVDAEGCYWLAGVDGWQIYRIAPTGELMQTIDLPVGRPTKTMFGGKNLDTLYFTSIAEGVENDPKQPQAGGLFAITGLGVKGLRQWRFAG